MKKNAPQFQLVSAKSKKSKLASIFDKLESSNAAFLAAAAQSSLATELARVKSAPNPAPIDNVRQHNPLTGKLGLNANELAKRAERRERFLAEQAAEASSAGMSSSSATLVQVREAQGHAARGLNTNLEKAYLRLTSLPSVADVRPPKVLAQALALVREKWKEVRNGGKSL